MKSEKQIRDYAEKVIIELKKLEREKEKRSYEMIKGKTILSTIMYILDDYKICNLSDFDYERSDNV